jgi:hypothetical protein
MQRGLFERHKLLFALMLTNKILVSSGKVKACDVDVLLKGGGALDIASVSTRRHIYVELIFLYPARGCKPERKDPSLHTVCPDTDVLEWVLL